jgi:hypothetical protein
MSDSFLLLVLGIKNEAEFIFMLTEIPCSNPRLRESCRGFNSDSRKINYCILLSSLPVINGSSKQLKGKLLSFCFFA